MKIDIQDVAIRLCDSNDVKDIFNLQNIIIDYFKEEEKGYFLPFDEKTYLRIVNNPLNDGEIYGAFLNGKMIAWIFLSVSNRMEQLRERIPKIEGRCADIDGVVVLPQYRGNGLQKLLVKYLEKSAKEKGINNIVAEVTFANKYSFNNLLDLGYQIKTSYVKYNTVNRYILLKQL